MNTYFLEGHDIYLREIRSSDANETYYRWLNDPEINRYLESRFYPTSLESIQSYVNSTLNNRDVVFCAIVLKATEQHIGNIKLGPIHWIHRHGDIGLLIGEKSCWGKGYASEAINLITDYAFKQLNLHKVTAGCYDDNQGSAKAFQKAGFSIEGIRKQHYHYNGDYINGILLGRIRDI